MTCLASRETLCSGGGGPTNTASQAPEARQTSQDSQQVAPHAVDGGRQSSLRTRSQGFMGLRPVKALRIGQTSPHVPLVPFSLVNQLLQGGLALTRG